VIPALGDTIDVTVDVISPQFDRASRTCDVLLRLKNVDGKVRPGMFVRAIVAGERFDDRLLVPKEAILTRDGRPLLFKVVDDRARWLYLKLGKENDNVVEVERVLQGGTLGPDDLVVVADHLTLSHDAKVKVKTVLPVQNPWGGRSKDI
jgi:multidrug efflux pump subunit AcrA (membrane-fusion protein)